MFVFYHCDRAHDLYNDVVRVGVEGGWWWVVVMVVGGGDGDGGDVCLL